MNNSQLCLLINQSAHMCVLIFFFFQMITESTCSCELVVKIGSNEYEEISNALNSLLRSCTIAREKFLFVERQIHPTSYFGSFTNSSSICQIPIQCQSLSCLIFLPDEFFHQHEKKDFFKSIHLWKFHHKIELVNEYQQIIARQDYYELSQYLPLWSIAHIPLNKQIIVRFNIFTKNFQSMLKFYQDLFQQKPDCSKSGFVLFHITSKKNCRMVYQFSLKSSSSIQSYIISQNAHLKIRLHHLNDFLHRYSSKLFTINQFEHYIYDPDGNLLHLCLHDYTSQLKTTSKTSINDSGFGDSSPSDRSIPFFHPQFSRIISPIDNQSYSSNDSGQCTSISSNDFHLFKSRVPHISVRSAKQSEVNNRLKQQEKAGERRRRRTSSCQWKIWIFRFLLALFLMSPKRSLYESEPRLSHSITPRNRFYSSMNNIRKKIDPIRPCSSIHFQTLESKTVVDDEESEVSYEVDSPRSSNSYLQRFLSQKQQPNVRQLITQFENSHLRPKSAPLVDFLPRLTSHPIDMITADDNDDDQTTNSRINIGITLDSRLRKTPVFDMLRSTMMESPRSNRSASHLPIARF